MLWSRCVFAWKYCGNSFCDRINAWDKAYKPLREIHSMPRRSWSLHRRACHTQPINRTVSLRKVSGHTSRETHSHFRWENQKILKEHFSRQFTCGWNQRGLCSRRGSSWKRNYAREVTVLKFGRRGGILLYQNSGEIIWELGHPNPAFTQEVTITLKHGCDRGA